MNVETFISMCSGLALFLYGMHFMGEQLKLFSGGRLQKLFGRMTDKTYKGVLLGCGITALIQSSSAVTVMAVGFVNSKMMTLSRAIAVIMGANIGTTITAWILSLTGISSDNIFISMLKPSFFAPIIAIISVFIFMFSKKEKRQNIGGIMVGFSVLMMGMTFMSDAMSSFADNPALSDFLLKLSHPLSGILAGALLTAVIQSSSASVGILQALSTTGCITFSEAFPIILGQNIGTCVTAVISAFGADKNGKRTAMAHLYFNIIGVTIVSVLYYLSDAVLNFGFKNMPVNASEIAVIHSAFNIFSTAVLLPFTKQLEWLAVKTIKN